MLHEELQSIRSALGGVLGRLDLTARIWCASVAGIWMPRRIRPRSWKAV